jgi:hypothetical protein
LEPPLASYLDRFPRLTDMAVLALHSKCTIMFIILVVATDTTGRLGQFVAYRVFMATDTLDVLVLPVQLEAGFIVIEIPIFPVTGIVASVAAFPERAFMHVLFFVTRPAIRLGLFKYYGEMAFFTFSQYVLPGKLKARHSVVKFNFGP